MDLIKGKNLAALAIVAILVAGVLGLASSDEGDTTYLVGSDDDNWWIDYPDMHPEAGSEVDHPEWVLDELEDKPVLILIHSTRCSACEEQEEGIENILEDVGDDITYQSITLDGAELEDYQTLDTYDPTGEGRYIPVTVAMTLVEGAEGDIQVGWHSYIGARGEDLLRSYVNDAIEHYEENSDDWNE